MSENGGTGNRGINLGIGSITKPATKVSTSAWNNFVKAWEAGSSAS